METSVTRRSFVGTGLGAAALAGCGLASVAMADEEAASAESVAWDGEADVLVVGGGGSGCSAALSAAEAGASVICIEAGNYLGGVSRLCVGSFTTPCSKLQEAAGVEDSYEVYREDARKLIGEETIAHAGADWALFEIQIAEGGKTVDWLVDHGVAFNGPLVYPGHTNDRMYMLSPNAQAWPAVIEAKMVEAGVQIYKGMRCVEYIKDEAGRVVGCRAEESASGEVRCFKGNNGVIHAAGSIDNCIDWKQKVVSNALADMDCANVFTDGSAFKALVAAGGDVTEWKSPLSQSMRTMGPGPDVGSVSKQKWMKFSIPQAGAILVNLEGKRYVNEIGSGNDIMVATNEQTSRRSWMVFDDACAQNFQAFPDMVVSSCPDIGWGTVDDFVERGGIVKAETIEELAEAIGVDPAGLATTIEEWNALCAAGEPDEFGRSSFGLEEAGTAGKGIVTPPFYAHGPQHGEMMFATLTSCINTDFQVLDVFGNPIPGLYAVGAGGHGKSPMGGGGHGGNMTWVFTSGRLCGEALATGQSTTADIVAAIPAAEEPEAEPETEAAPASYADGTYTGVGTGMGGKINVTIEVSGGTITVTDISPNNETQGLGGYEAIEDGTFAAQVEEAQSSEIDGIAGATLTSDAIRDAVADALSQAAA